MEMQGLVKKVRNERKTNTYRIRLTRKGLLAYQKVLEIDIFPRIIQTLSDEKREQFRECLEELSDRVNKSLK
jgi:DNA-binding MarR family transcriptional regulator